MVRNVHKVVTKYGAPPYPPDRKSLPPESLDGPVRSPAPHYVMDVHAFFKPLVSTLRYTGFFIALKDDDEKDDVSSRRVCRKIGRGVLHCARMGYLFLMWCWTLMMSINIIYMVISGAPESLTVKNGKEGHHGNLVIILLDECPFAVIAIRNATILTLLLHHADRLREGLQACEDLRLRLSELAGPVSFERFRRRPLAFIVSAIIVILLFEIYEWSVWLDTDPSNPRMKTGTTGPYYDWNFTPFPFSMYQYQYACFWWVFTSVPFFLSQLALCFPVLFAYVIRRYLRLINKELALLATMDSSPQVSPREWAARIRHLRGAHFDIGHLLHQVDKACNHMLLVQFICDIFILFGFVGNLVNSRDARPPKATLEWTFYIPASITWLLFFLLHFSFPLIHMSQEAERTHAIVHTLSFSSPANLQESFNELQIFLAETKDGTHMAFTGANFYCVNRHYVVTCVALLVSYLTVLTEILDRYYGNEDIREAISRLAMSSSINNSKDTAKTANTDLHDYVEL